MEFVFHDTADDINCARLVVDELNLPDYDKIKHLLIFNVKTYVKLGKNKGPEGWEVTFGAVNSFMNSLCESDKVALAQTIILMHDDIENFFRNPDLLMIQHLTRNLSNQLDVLDQQTDICDKLRAYIVQNMPIGLFEGAGKRAQDSDALTFHPNEVIDLMMITLLCKMLSPLFSSIMQHLNKQIDNHLKETHCVAIFTNLFKRKYQRLIEKLQNYIKHTVEQVSEESLTSLVYGYDAYSLSYYMFGQLLVRQLVNVDLSIRDGNLMTYVMVSVKQAVQTVKSSINKMPTYPRKVMTAKHEDDGNTAQVEIDSITSKKTFDVTTLVAAAVPLTIKKYLNLYQIDKSDYEAVMNYYAKNPILPLVINKDMNSMFYNKDFGGGKGILMLKGGNYASITALLQMIIFQLDSNYVELGHAMTMLPSIDVNLDCTINDSQFKLTAGSSPSYRKCRQIFENSPYGTKGKEWDSYISKTIDKLITSGWVYNTADWIWDWLGMDNLNGKLFRPTEMTITAFCSFYEWINETRKV